MEDEGQRRGAHHSHHLPIQFELHRDWANISHLGQLVGLSTGNSSAISSTYRITYGRKEFKRESRQAETKREETPEQNLNIRDYGIVFRRFFLGGRYGIIFPPFGGSMMMRGGGCVGRLVEAGSTRIGAQGGGTRKLSFSVCLLRRNVAAKYKVRLIERETRTVSV